MKPLPNIHDEAAMLERGRRSALMSARNETCEALRDCATSAQSIHHPQDLAQLAPTLRKLAERMEQIASLYAQLEQGRQSRLPLVEVEA